MTHWQPNTRNHIGPLLAIWVLLILGFFLAQKQAFHTVSHVHTLVEIVSTLLILFAGTAALLRSKKLGSHYSLVIGLAFMGAAVLDLGHALITSDADLLQPQSQLLAMTAGSGVASRQFLALMLVYSLLLWRYEKRHGVTWATKRHALYWCTLSIMVVSVVSHALLPLLIGAGTLGWLELGPGLLFLVALLGFLRKGDWHEDAFEYWLLLSLLLAFASQTMLMVSVSNYDSHFATAHFFKVVSYLLLLVGLITQIFSTLQREAREGREFHHAIVNMAAEGIITFEPNGTIHSFNPAAEQLFGYPAAVVIGDDIRMLMPESCLSRYDNYIGLDNEDADFTKIAADVEALREDGSSVAIRLAVNRISVDGSTMFTAMVHDISERKKQTAELTVARDKADKANESKSLFLASMSHEIRTPMSGVIGMIEVLRQTNLDGSQTEMANLVSESAQSLLGIVDDILDYSKIEAGKLEIGNAPIEISKIVESTCAMLTQLAAESDVTLNVRIDSGIPHQVLGDGQRLRQVLVNLVNNSIKFSSKQDRAGRVSVRVELLDCQASTATIQFHVMDNGIGMDEAALAGLFTPFTQANASMTEHYGGTGLGLSISHRLVEMMGGEITAESAPDKGSTFSVKLPCEVLSSVPAPATASNHLAGISCLVVGGKEGLAPTFEIYLQQAGATVTQVPDLTSAQALDDRQQSGLWVWVVDADSHSLSPEEVLASMPLSSKLRTVAIIIERGQRHIPRYLTPDMITIDGNAVDSKAFISVVSDLCGHERIVEKPSSSITRPKELSAAPSRAEAIAAGQLLLVAEDNPMNRHVLKAQLGALGYTADFASNGRKALECLADVDYALLLTDLHMPEMDGYTLAATIRDEESVIRQLPIIALTADVLAGEQKGGPSEHIDDFLSKPFTLEKLEETLSKWLPQPGSGARVAYPLQLNTGSTLHRPRVND